MKLSGHRLSMSPSVSPPTVAFGQFGYATHQNTSGAASPITPSTVSGSSCCEPLTLRLSTGVSGGQHGLLASSASTIHPNPNSVTPLSMDTISNNRFNATTGGLANVSHHHNSPTTPSAFYATKPSTYADTYCNPTVIDPAAVSFYQTLPNYGFKDAAAAAATWAHGIAAQSAAANYYYDPAFTQYGYSPGYDFNGAARRKNVTRDSTTTLKAWLNEHRKNPYPTKGEKIMLAIITKMTLTQVSTWFANARRRLKKENKMTWEPRNRCDDNDDDIITSDDDDDNKQEIISESNQTSNMNQITTNKDMQTAREYNHSSKDPSEVSRGHSNQLSSKCIDIPLNSAITTCSSANESQHNFTEKCNPTNNSTKPKIWSLAATAIDDKPKSPLSHQHNNNLSPNLNLAPPLHLTAHNVHSNAFSASTPTNMTGWYHHTHNHSHTTPYTSVNPYGAHYMPSLQRHFQQTSVATTLPPQADTPPQTPPALKLASMQLLSSERGAIASEQVNCVQQKIITYRNQGEQIGQSGNTSPPTQIYGSEFRIANDDLSDASHTFGDMSSVVHHQTQDSNNNNNNSNNNK